MAGKAWQAVLVIKTLKDSDTCQQLCTVRDQPLLKPWPMLVSRRSSCMRRRAQHKLSIMRPLCTSMQSAAAHP